MNNAESVGAKIHGLRTAQRLSLRHLAIKMNNDVTTEAIRKWENGTVLPKNNKLNILAQALGVDITYFFPDYNTERETPLDAKEFIKQMVNDGVSQQDIAIKCGLSQGTIHKIIRTNSVITLETIKKIAIAYNKPLSFFLSDLEQQPASMPLSDADVNRIADVIVTKLKSVLTLP